ncbi:MAG TPA: CCA tRNA nucleotidyltransferase, partial [Kiloniellales bacterium]|nr:CCA tRNA nucleotidyltransferase [Kiloniellales bacterium]
FGGIADLKAGRIRFVGDARARITEDYLRLLRFFRFQAHYGRVPPEPDILEITEELAPNLQRLSGERIRDELLRLLEAPDPLPVVEILLARGILAQVLPVSADAKVLRRLLRTESDRSPDDGTEPPNPIPRLAAILEPGREPAEAVAERLRLSNRQRFALVQLGDPPIHPDDEPSAKLRHRAMRKLGLPLYLDLLRLDWARHHAGESGRRPKDRFAAARREAERHAAKPFPLQGRDLLALGVPEGPKIGELLEAVEDWWAESDFAPSRKECLAHAMALIEGQR